MSTLSYRLTRPFLYALLRYTLSFFMLSFGIMKLTGRQFAIVLPVSTLGQPVASLSGQQLTWTFMGHSSVFQFLLGCFEVIPALLLLFRRSALAGALLLLPSSVGVCLINFCFGLWANTRLLSCFLLLLNLAILYFVRPRLSSFFSMIVGRASGNSYFVAGSLSQLHSCQSSLFEKLL